MYDVFISFSTRGATKTDWIISFRENLKREYLSTYRKAINIWDMTQNTPGDNFETEIEKALQDTHILITVLDPLYLDSPQTLVEIQKYTRNRIAAGQPVNIIKVITKKGNADIEMRQLINNSILVSYFSTTGPNNIETALDEGSTAYKTEIEKIAGAIRGFIVEDTNRANAARLKTRLAEMKDTDKIYVAYGDRTLTDNRVKFINQLSDTLQHNNSKKLQAIKVLPDNFTLSLQDFTYPDMGELLCVGNDNLESCVDSMLEAGHSVIIPFETDNISEAEDLLKRLSLQLDIIWRRAIQKNMTVHILLNIPDVLFETPSFKQEFNNPAFSSYSNIKIIKKQDIASFINSLVLDIQKGMDPESLKQEVRESDEKFIYLIEYNNTLVPVAANELTEKESHNRDEMKKLIRDEHFDVVTNFDIRADAELNEAIDKHKYWLSLSQGIIIYRGIRETDDWCRNQQGATFKALKDLKKDRIGRAVFVDPLQANKEIGAYSIFKYDVLLDNPAHLKNFLCKIH